MIIQKYVKCRFTAGHMLFLTAIIYISNLISFQFGIAIMQ